MKIDKQNGNVCFNDELHKYFDVNDESKQYISVTTLIGKFEQPFDKEFWSAYKALEKLISKDSWVIEKKSLLAKKKFDKEILSIYNITDNDFNREQQAILDEWDKTNRESCERGTKIHSELENSFYKTKHNISLQKFGIGGKFECKKDYSDLDLEYGVYPEYLIYYEDKDLRLAGQIDLIVKSGNDIIICDWKTNKKIEKKGGFNTSTKQTTKMKFPLNTLDDANYWHYTLQLSTYAWMLQKLHPEFNIKDLVLVHFDHNNNQTVYHIDYLKKDVERMLYYYRKQIMLDDIRAKRQPIEY